MRTRKRRWSMIQGGEGRRGERMKMIVAGDEGNKTREVGS
jgi:hypothetical protein